MPLELLAQPAHRVLLARLVLPAPPVRQVRRALPVLRAPLAPLARLALPAPPVRRVRQVRQVRRALPVLRDPLVLPARLRRLFMHNNNSCSEMGR